jgi:hypothetical protein
MNMKTKQILSFFFFILFVVLTGTSCRKENSTSANQDSRMGIQITAYNKSAQLPVQTGVTKAALVGSAATVIWDTASFVVSSVNFSAEMKSKLAVANHENEDEHHLGYSRDSVEIHFSWNGKQTINLFNLNTVFGGFMLNPGVYDELELSVKGKQSDSGSQPVFYLSGTYTTSALLTRRIVVAINQDISFKTEQDSVTVTGNGVNLVSVVELYLNKLMAGVAVSSLDNATLLSNGTLLISVSSNPELYATILQNLRLDHPLHHHHEGENDGHQGNGD